MANLKMTRVNGWTYITADGEWEIKNVGRSMWSILNLKLWNSDNCYDAESDKQYFQTYATAKAALAELLAAR